MAKFLGNKGVMIGVQEIIQYAAMATLETMVQKERISQLLAQEIAGVMDEYANALMSGKALIPVKGQGYRIGTKEDAMTLHREFGEPVPEEFDEQTTLIVGGKR